MSNNNGNKKRFPRHLFEACQNLRHQSSAASAVARMFFAVPFSCDIVRWKSCGAAHNAPTGNGFPLLPRGKFHPGLIPHCKPRKMTITVGEKTYFAPTAMVLFPGLQWGTITPSDPSLPSRIWNMEFGFQLPNSEFPKLTNSKNNFQLFCISTNTKLSDNTTNDFQYFSHSSKY